MKASFIGTEKVVLEFFGSVQIVAKPEAKFEIRHLSNSSGSETSVEENRLTAKSLTRIEIKFERTVDFEIVGDLVAVEFQSDYLETQDRVCLANQVGEYGEEYSAYFHKGALIYPSRRSDALTRVFWIAAAAGGSARARAA